MTQEFILRDVFEVVRGSGTYTKAYIQNHKGEYPVYSGNTIGAFASIDHYDHAVPCLSWAIDGLAGYMMIHEEEFSATNHRGVLIPKMEGLNLQYAKHILEPIFRELKKGRTGENGENEYTSLPPFMVDGIRFRLPVTANGELDVAAQDALAQKLIYLEQLKQTVQEKRDDMAEVVITLDNTDYKMAYFPITDLFTTEKGKAKYTKKYGNLHSGEYPVYSASSSKPLTHMDTFDYDGKYLTWSTNGFAGTILVIEGKFSINGDRGILVPKVEDERMYGGRYAVTLGHLDSHQLPSRLFS